MKRIPDDIAAKLMTAIEAMPLGSGFDISIDDAARLAEVPRATLYYYFSGRTDLTQFYLNTLIDQTRSAVEKAAANEGSAADRLNRIMSAVIDGFAEFPRMCIEMASAFKASDDHAAFLANVDSAVIEPLRSVLFEGSHNGEFQVTDAAMAANAIMGSLHQVSLMEIIMTGGLDPKKLETALFPQLLSGLLPR